MHRVDGQKVKAVVEWIWVRRIILRVGKGLRSEVVGLLRLGNGNVQKVIPAPAAKCMRFTLTHTDRSHTSRGRYSLSILR